MTGRLEPSVTGSIRHRSAIRAMLAEHATVNGGYCGLPELCAAAPNRPGWAHIASSDWREAQAAKRWRRMALTGRFCRKNSMGNKAVFLTESQRGR